jgi:transmembrane sensor
LRAVTWRSGVLQLPEEGAPISAVLDELTRYTDKHIIMRDPRIAGMKVGGRFSTRDVKSALEKLQMGVPGIEVHESDGLYTLDLRPSATERN